MFMQVISYYPRNTPTPFDPQGSLPSLRHGSAATTVPFSMHMPTPTHPQTKPQTQHEETTESRKQKSTHRLQDESTKEMKRKSAEPSRV